MQGWNVKFLNICQDGSRWVLHLGWDNWRTFISQMCSQRSLSYILKQMKIEEVIQSWNIGMVDRSNFHFPIGAKDGQSYRKMSTFVMMDLDEFSTWVEITW